MTRYGTLVTIDSRPAVRFERRYRHPIERVWRAVTDPAEMAQWFPSNVEGERAVGAELRFADDEQRAAAHEAGEPTRDDAGPMFRGRVVVYDPPQVFSFTWGAELLRIELAPDGDGTRLTFTHLLSHPSVAARNGAGWHACLAELDSMLGEPPPADAGWKQVYDGYLDRMGPALGVPAGDGAMTWERATHVAPDRVREVVTDPGEAAAWGAADGIGDPITWDVSGRDGGTVYRLTHQAVGDDAEVAAAWHARLVQLDMYLAAGQLVPADPKTWLDAYRRLL
jgi:uncharacterized protein YndB with AHSA1/START domain